MFSYLFEVACNLLCWCKSFTVWTKAFDHLHEDNNTSMLQRKRFLNVSFFIESVTSRLDQEYSTNSVVQTVTFGSQVQIQHHNDYISEAVQQSTVKYWTQG